MSKPSLFLLLPLMCLAAASSAQNTAAVDEQGDSVAESLRLAMPQQCQPDADHPFLDARINHWAELRWVPGSLLEDETDEEQRRQQMASCNFVYCGGYYIRPEGDPNAEPSLADLKISAQSSVTSGNQSTLLSGDVDIRNGYRHIRANRATLDHQSRELRLEEGIKISEPSLLVLADTAELNTQTGEGTLDNARFVFFDTGFRGRSDTIHRLDEYRTVLTNSWYSSCPPDKPDWALQSEKVSFDKESGWVVAEQATVRVRDVPILYVPKMSFPIDDRRLTGFLWPQVGSSDDGGLDYSQPYYLNLAPHYDATITPRYIGGRGAMLSTEFRYLFEHGQWDVGAAYLGDDDRFADDYLEPDDGDNDRWLTRVAHLGSFAPGWVTLVDYSRASDIHYFRDLSDSGLDVRRKTHLEQRAEMRYSNLDWRFTAELRDYQAMGENVVDPYQSLPKLNLSYSTARVFSPNVIFESEYAYFEHKNRLDGHRVYNEIGTNYPMVYNGGFFTPTVKLKNIITSLAEPVDGQTSENPAVTVPMLSLDAGMFFERDLKLSENSYLQTLEPRLFYLYSKYEDQSDLPIFDTAELSYSYNQLFRERRFSGNDRIADANQVSLGLGSSFYETGTGREVLNVAVGQIYYFEDRRVFTDSDTIEDERSSDYAAVVSYNPTPRWRTHLSLQSDPEDGKMQFGSLRANFADEAGRLVNVGYSYRRQSSLLVDGELQDRDVEQSDISMMMPVRRSWSVVARWRYDVTNERTIEDLVGLEYDSCCWTMRLLHQRQREQLGSDVNNVESSYGIYLQFELKGLGGTGSKLENILSNSIYGYGASARRREQ